jgi:hypothetical protein
VIAGFDDLRVRRDVVGDGAHIGRERIGTAMWSYLTSGYPDVIGSLLPRWTEERLRIAEQETEHYLYGTVTVARPKGWVRDDAAIARRDARLLAMDLAEFRQRRRVG